MRQQVQMRQWWNCGLVNYTDGNIGKIQMNHNNNACELWQFILRKWNNKYHPSQFPLSIQEFSVLRITNMYLVKWWLYSVSQPKLGTLFQNCSHSPRKVLFLFLIWNVNITVSTLHMLCLPQGWSRLSSHSFRYVCCVADVSHCLAVHI